jgi:hypothetical protein
MDTKSNNNLSFDNKNSKGVNSEIKLRSFDEIVQTEVKSNTIFNRNLFQKFLSIGSLIYGGLFAFMPSLLVRSTLNSYLRSIPIGVGAFGSL